MKVLAAGLISLMILLPSVNFASTKVSEPSAKITMKHSVININQADAKSLSQLKGIGEKKAENIVAYRNKNGSFKSVEDLEHVKGISPSIIKENKDNLKI